MDGDTPKERRKRVIQDFRDGKITVLSNVELFGEGFDVPDCECVVLLRPTMSLTLHIQQSMRSMRYKENKTAIIIDNVGNVYRHGLPDDEREWSLQGKRRKEKFEIRIKQCPKCLSCMPGNARACSVCGYEFAVTETERAEMENINTELQRIQAEDILKSKLYNEYRNIDNWEEIERFRKAKKI